MSASSGSTSRLPSLGPRGEGWVAIQFVLVGATVGAAFLPPRWPDTVDGPFSVAGAALAVAGGAFSIAAVRALGRSFTPLPRPGESAELVERGPYRYVRHPIYGAVLLFAAGFSLLTSIPALAGACALAVCWALKSRVEERFLAARYPAYAAYLERTPRRFLPSVW